MFFIVDWLSGEIYYEARDYKDIYTWITRQNCNIYETHENIVEVIFVI